MLADLAVLSRPVFDIDSVDLLGVSAELTVVGGQVVHASEHFAGIEL